MTKKRTIWILVIGAIAIIAAAVMLYGGTEQKPHEGAKFVSACAADKPY